MLYLNTFRLHALLNATQIVLYYESGPPQPTSNATLLVDIQTKKKGPQWRSILLIQKESNFNISSGDFQQQPGH